MNLIASEIEILTDEVGAEVRDDYSGRGMYGETTTAIVAGSKDYVLSMLSDLARDALDCNDTGRADELNTLIGKVARASQDSMGKSDMVIY